MLSCYTITIQTETGNREILVSPFLLQSKGVPDIKPGAISKLFFYENWIDEDYKANLKQELLTDRFKSHDFVINYGQDFNKYYLGCLSLDSDNKCFNDQQEQRHHLTDKEINTLSEVLFNPDAQFRRITIFTPTRPSDFNLRRI